MKIISEDGYLLLSVLYILLFMTLTLSLATYLMTNQLTYAKDTIEAYRARAGINMVSSMVQKSMDEGQEITKGQVSLSTGIVTVEAIESNHYQMTFENSEGLKITQEKYLNDEQIQKIKREIDIQENKMKEEEKEEKEASESEEFIDEKEGLIDGE